ncbi:MAG: hypothetical protein JSS75_01175 [Bacteroidetes bacterium]|nr:hypothetical protein [Bacteroidota bacterium]
MKSISMALCALMFSASVIVAQPQGGQGQGTGKGTQLKTQIQQRKQLRKRDSTGVYHEQNVKSREARQKANRATQGSGAKRRGQGQGQGQRKGQGGKQ